MLAAQGPYLHQVDSLAGLSHLLVNSFRTWQNHLSKGLRAMHQRGELRADVDPDDLAAALLAAVQGELRLAQAARSTY